jgi:hypothetical protein
MARTLHIRWLHTCWGSYVDGRRITTDALGEGWLNGGQDPANIARIVGSPSETAVACHKLLNAQLTYGFAEANNPAISPLLQADSRPRCADAVTQFRITQKMPVTR